MVVGNLPQHRSFLIWQDFSEISTKRLAVHNGKKVIKTVLMNYLLWALKV